MALKDLINSSASLEGTSEPSSPLPGGKSDMDVKTLGIETALADGDRVQNDGQAEVPSNEDDPKPSSEADAKGKEGVAAESQIPRGVSEVVTPSGISIYYQAAPKRLYRVNGPERPSVSEVLDILAKGGLPWWGMETGVAGVLELLQEGNLQYHPQIGWQDAESYETIPNESVIKLLTKHKLTVNHVRDQAGDRGTSVHTALELWAKTGKLAISNVFPPEEQGYVQGLNKFIVESGAAAVASEVMVASVKHKYAGRYDLDALLGDGADGAQVFTHITPKGRGDKKEAIEDGLWRIDLKTSGAVYDSYHLQIEAYEEAARECGYPATENRAILRVTEDGRYELKRSKATFADFKAVLGAFRALQRVKAR